MAKKLPRKPPPEYEVYQASKPAAEEIDDDETPAEPAVIDTADEIDELDEIVAGAEPSPAPFVKAAAASKAKTANGKAPVAVAGHATASYRDDRTEKVKKAGLATWTGADPGKRRDVFFARQAAEARKEFGHSSVFLGSESKGLIIGIPCPALAFEFVIGQDCFPLGLVMQIVAKFGVGKSALAAEFGRWFDMALGGTNLMENETKFNPDWYISIMGQEMFDRVLLHRCKSVQDWQRRMTSSIKRTINDCNGTKKEPGPGRTVPVLFIVDSVMGKMSEENQEKVVGKVGADGQLGDTGDGFAAARAFPVEAGSITKYMRTVPQLVDGWPFALVLINHLRDQKDDMGNAVRNKTGGEQLNFQESFELEIKKIGGHKKRIESVDYEGVRLAISCEKNSFGPTHRRVDTRMLWWYEDDPVTGLPIQRSVWDWDWSTVHMLDNILRGQGASIYLRTRLKAAGVHLECPKSSDVDNLAWSRNLGMKSAEDGLAWTEVGALIREDRELVNTIRNALGIARRPLLAGDYLKQLGKLAAEEAP